MSNNNNKPASESAPQLPSNADAAWENDPVWALLRQSPPVSADAGFADRVMAGLRDETAQHSTRNHFGSRMLRYALPIAAAAACIVATVLMTRPAPEATIVSHPTTEENAFADLDEATNQELLLAATDHLHEFSDTELVTLIGF